MNKIKSHVRIRELCEVECSWWISFRRSDWGVNSANCDEYLFYHQLLKLITDCVRNCITNQSVSASIVSRNDAERLADIRIELAGTVLTPQFDILLGGDDEHFAQYSLIQL